MSPKRDKAKNAFTVTGVYTISIVRVHVVVVVVLAIIVLSLVLTDEALDRLIEWLTLWVSPTGPSS